MFFKGAKIGSANNALHTIPPANTTNIYDSQHANGCFRENVWEPATSDKKVKSMFWQKNYLVAYGYSYSTEYLLLKNSFLNVKGCFASKQETGIGAFHCHVRDINTMFSKVKQKSKKVCICVRYSRLFLISTKRRMWGT